MNFINCSCCGISTPIISITLTAIIITEHNHQEFYLCDPCKEKNKIELGHSLIKLFPYSFSVNAMKKDLIQNQKEYIENSIDESMRLKDG